MVLPRPLAMVLKTTNCAAVMSSGCSSRSIELQMALRTPVIRKPSSPVESCDLMLAGVVFIDRLLDDGRKLSA